MATDAGVIAHHLHMVRNSSSAKGVVMSSALDLAIAVLGFTASFVFAGAVNEFSDKIWPEHGWHRGWSETLAAFVLVVVMWLLVQRRNTQHERAEAKAAQQAQAAAVDPVSARKQREANARAYGQVSTGAQVLHQRTPCGSSFSSSSSPSAVRAAASVQSPPSTCV